jgi:hypothetical protein
MSWPLSGSAEILAKLAAAKPLVQPAPCRCWAVGHHEHANHCCMTPKAKCHETEGQAILENGTAA